MLGKFPNIKNVIIYVKLPEAELIKRLEARGERWIAMYDDIRKASFEPPTDDDADEFLEYDQYNYAEISETLKNLL